MRVIKCENKYLTKKGTWAKDINKALLIVPQKSNNISCVEVFNKRVILSGNYVLLNPNGQYLGLNSSVTSTLQDAKIFDSEDILEMYGTYYGIFGEQIKRLLKKVVNKDNKCNLYIRNFTSKPKLGECDSEFQLLRNIMAQIGFTLIKVTIDYQVREEVK